MIGTTRKSDCRPPNQACSNRSHRMESGLEMKNSNLLMLAIVAVSHLILATVCLGQSNDSTQQTSELAAPIAPGVVSGPNQPKQDRIDLSIQPTGKSPALKQVPSADALTKDKTYKSVQWASSEFLHRGLYFEEPCLERYGSSKNTRLQPIYSGVKFYSRGILFPFSWLAARFR